MSQLYIPPSSALCSFYLNGFLSQISARLSARFSDLALFRPSCPLYRFPARRLLASIVESVVLASCALLHALFLLAWLAQGGSHAVQAICPLTYTRTSMEPFSSNLVMSWFNLTPATLPLLTVAASVVSPSSCLGFWLSRIGDTSSRMSGTDLAITTSFTLTDTEHRQPIHSPRQLHP